MADWTTLPDSSLEPGKPMRSIDGLALRDNPIAIAEGAAGAPKVLAAGLATGDNERDWVLARTAGASVGAVGSYAFLNRLTVAAVNPVPSITPGQTLSGSSLRYADADNNQSGTSLAGTWRCMGFSLATFDGLTSNTSFRPTLWLRIS